MKPSSYSLLKFVYLTGQWRHSLEVHPPEKNPGSAPVYQTASNVRLFFNLLYYIRFAFQKLLSLLFNSFTPALNFSMAILPRTVFGKNSWLWYQIWTEISIFLLSSWFRAECFEKICVTIFEIMGNEHFISFDMFPFSLLYSKRVLKYFFVLLYLAAGE